MVCLLSCFLTVCVNPLHKHEKDPVIVFLSVSFALGYRIGRRHSTCRSALVKVNMKAYDIQMWEYSEVL